MESLINQLDDSGIPYLENELLSGHTSFKIGGPARLMVLPRTVEEIRRVVQLSKTYGWPFFILGNGSNILFADQGYDGLVIKIGKNFSEYNINGTKVTAQSGALLSSICKKAARQGLAGAEFGTGIPGTVGGGVVMNAGAYDGELKDVISSVTVMDKEGTIYRYSNQEMQFGYRTSRVYQEGLIVLEMTMELQPGDMTAIWEKIDDFTTRRWRKQPIDLPSGGSTFKRPPGYYAGKLIEDSGCKGLRFRDAQVSPKHSGFVVNLGSATSKDVRTLIRLVQRRVKEAYGVGLETEVKLIGNPNED
ncbi:MAG: UDP-N-acetylmuramate dehydrogenase [Tissierellia bacterium]|nr:UDP-N-acetylmuramate dehydrogenase [Tissierellia bacterium]